MMLIVIERSKYASHTPNNSSCKQRGPCLCDHHLQKLTTSATTARISQEMRRLEPSCKIGQEQPANAVFLYISTKSGKDSLQMRFLV
jgi:hypothetical protein